ncbi:MAG: O-antigen ligase family protein [Akkermansiaceae bacterium]|nr:O-antigen ligase family protein [Akkermansiaceae bacterium]
MNMVASGLLMIAVWLAVLLGPQLSPWAWGASLLALGGAVLAVLPGLWRGGSRRVDGWLFGVGVVTVMWFAMRAWMSPVAEDGMMDLLLLAAGVAGFLVMRGTQDSGGSERVLVWGLGLLLLASVVVVVRQVWDPAFTPGFIRRFSYPSGFFGHYNYGANFLIGASCLVGGAAMFWGGIHRAERIILGLVALAGISVVYFTGSRGGQIGAAMALAMFVVLAMVGGGRQGAKWFAPGVIALPLVGIGLVAFLIHGWARSQEDRGQDSGVETVVDNAVRLHLLSIATSCVAEHPWEGGGSRSFSWECNRFWDTDAHGAGQNRPEQVHNEILQTATDYGLVGAGLLVLFVGSIMVGGVLRMLFGERGTGERQADSWRIGGMAGLVGLLVQSNFSFVFHLLPGALLLGIILGRATYAGGTVPDKPAGLMLSSRRLIGALCALACAALILPMGWLGTRVIGVRWADRFGKPPQRGDEVMLGALTQAIAIWPLEEFYLDRAVIYQKQAAAAAAGNGDGDGLTALALADYGAASALNPFDPMPVINQAVLLGEAGRETAAMQASELAIRLQGGMEGAYKGVFQRVSYLRAKGEKLLQESRGEEALEVFLKAREELLKSYEFPSGTPLGKEARELRVAIAARLGGLLSTAGRDAEAEAEFEDAAKVWGGTGIRFYHAWHCDMVGTRVWGERRAPEALRLFLKGQWLIDRTGAVLPSGVTREDQLELRKRLVHKIQILKAGKVEPSPEPPK